MSEEVPVIDDYNYGFRDEGEIIFSTGKGLSEAVVRTISAEKKESQWMLDYRLRAFKMFEEQPIVSWGPDLSGLDLADITYYQRATNQPARSWEDVPQEIKETFQRLGSP